MFKFFKKKEETKPAAKRYKKGFPHMKNGEPYGWEDRGTTGSWSNKKDFITFATHRYCSNRIHVGLEKGSPFKFCPTCLVKLEK